MSSRLSLLPGEFGFAEILATPPPEPSQAKNFVVRAGQMVAEAVDDHELTDYLEGGEYDQRLCEIQSQEPAVTINEALTSDILYLPCSVQLP